MSTLKDITNNIYGKLQVIGRDYNRNRFFQNKKCEWFPCHSTTEENFNCLFCYCPLYHQRNCGGNYKILECGIKDCSNCTIPHTDYKFVINQLTKNKPK